MWEVFFLVLVLACVFGLPNEHSEFRLIHNNIGNGVWHERSFCKMLVYIELNICFMLCK